jgi:hypothetical protein
MWLLVVAGTVIGPWFIRRVVRRFPDQSNQQCARRPNDTP